MQEQITSIYNQYMTDIYRYCYARLRNKEQAEDITAETFLALMAVSDTSKIESMKLWLIGVARNKLIDKYRRAEAKVVSDMEIEVAENLVPEEADTLENIHIEEELLKEIQAELNNLDENLREVLILKHWEDLKFNEMALVLGVNENTVKSRYYNALDTMKNNVNKKSRKKMRVISFPLLFLALPKIKADAAFAPTTQFTSNLINLVIKNSNMNKFVLWIKSHKLAAIIASCVIAGLILAGVIFLLANGGTNNSNGGNATSSTSSATSSVTSTSASSTSSQTTTTVSSTPSTTTTPVVQLQSCTNTVLGIQVFYPAGWTCVINNQSQSGHYTVNLSKGNVNMSLGTLVRSYICNPEENCATEPFYSDANTTVQAVKWNGVVSMLTGQTSLAPYTPAEPGSKAAIAFDITDGGAQIPFSAEIKQILSSMKKI